MLILVAALQLLLLPVLALAAKRPQVQEYGKDYIIGSDTAADDSQSGLLPTFAFGSCDL